MEPISPGHLAYNRVSGGNATQRAQQLTRQAGGAEDQRLRDVCEQFEAIFVKLMLTSMRNTVEKSGLVDGGMAEEVFEDMLYDEYSGSIAKTTRLGISEMLYKELSQVKPVISP
jgi:flagellar protein FlgJ